MQAQVHMLDLGRKLGKGTFGEVFYGLYDKLPCAIKRTWLNSDIEQEIAVFQTLSFKNVIQFYGTTTHEFEGEDRLLIIMEYAENGSLTHAIKEGTLQWQDKERITQDIVCGLQYLHKHNVLHRDLKSDNVLLTNNYDTAKLCDFGVSKVRLGCSGQTGVATTTDQHAGTTRWMAPELFVASPEHTTKTDIYALGWIMWQLAANCPRPLPSFSDSEVVVHIAANKRETIPADTPLEYRQELECCWHQDPSSRPEAVEMIKEDSFFQAGNKIEETQDDGTECCLELDFDDDVSSVKSDPSEEALVSDKSTNSTFEKEKTLRELEVVQATGSNTPRPALEIQPSPGQCSATTEASHDNSAPDSQLPVIIVRDYGSLAEANDKDAQYALGVMYMNSKGITHSDFEALYWFRRAADLGHREAQFLIGQLYENDKVLYKDNSRAVQWYRLAARQGHTEAQERLDAIVKKRRRLCPDYAHSPSDDPDGPDAPACHYVPRTPHSSVDHVETDQVFTVPVLSRDDDKDDVDDSSGFSNEPPTGDTTDSGTGGLRGASPSAGSKAAEESRASSTSPLIIDEWIGGSESCPVYQVRSFVTTYAAKKFHIPYNEQHRNAFKQEIAALERLRHPNLIQLFDTHEQDGSLYLMMEFAASGSLTNAIAHSQLDWSLKVRITQDIARGLDYLHRKNIVHRNIKSNNILLTPGIVAKLCDVGLDSVTTTNRATPDDWMEGDEQRIEGNERWMAPELFADPPRYSTKSDMFAFGVVMWQMAAESVRPFLPLSIDKVAQVIQDGCREEIPDHTPAKYEMWIRKCWHQEFENRPEASDLVSFSMDPASLPSGHVSTLTLEGDGGDSMVPPFAGLTKDEIYAQRSMGVLRAKNALALLRRKRDTAASKDRRVDPEDERPGDAASTRDGVVDIPSKDARQSSFNLTHLLNECKELVRHGSTNQTRLQCALERISRLLGNTSSSSQALETSQSFRDDVVAAESVVSAATQLDPDTEATLQESAPTQVQSEFQRELAKLKTDLLRTEELREFLDREVPTKGRDATEEHGVEQELTNSKVVLDEASARPARFGCLYWATVGDGKMMLVKQLDEIYGTSKEATLRRVKALTHQLRHCKGILQIRAIQFPDLIIYGSQNAIPLDMYLSQNKLSLQDKWLVAFKMANALRYVHECNIIHRDIRAASVFMVETTPGVFEPKLAGFETCRSGMAVTVGSVDEDDVWKAPETRLGHGWSKEAGVFAFGILMYEITMGSPPQWNVNCTGTVYEKTKQNVADWIEKSYNTAPSPRYAVLMQKCLDADHMHRPTMENVFIELSEGF